MLDDECVALPQAVENAAEKPQCGIVERIVVRSIFFAVSEVCLVDGFAGEGGAFFEGVVEDIVTQAGHEVFRLGGAHAVTVPYIAAVEDEGVPPGFHEYPMWWCRMEPSPVTKVEFGVVPDDGFSRAQAEPGCLMWHIGIPAVFLAACLLNFLRNLLVENHVQ